jgi:4-amino-4-deoxy-L-arabinose transferase-like glycosyltransferase
VRTLLGHDARRLLLGAATLGFVVRMAFGLIYWQGKPLTHDEREYLALAANVAAGRGFTHELPNEPPYPDVQRYGRAPVYPLFLAPIVAFDPALGAGRMPQDVPDAVKIAQALVGAIGVWLIGSIAAHVGGARMGAVAALIASVYPPLVWICAYALSEALYSALALACVWVLAPALDGLPVLPSPQPSPRRGEGAPQTRLVLGTTQGLETGALPLPSGERVGVSGARLFAGGVLIGIAILARPATLFVLPFVLLLAWKRGAAWPALMLIATLLVVLPWTARNAAVYDRFVLVASEGGVTFWTGNHREAGGEGDLAANPHLKRLNQEFRTRHPGLTEEQLEPIYYREALRFIAEAPGRWLGLLAKKLFYTWIPIGPSYRLHSPRYFWTSALSYGLLLPVAILGGWRLWRNGRRPRTLWALAASACLASVIFFPQERFRIPVIDPTLIVCAAAALTSDFGARRNPRR